MRGLHVLNKLIHIHKRGGGTRRPGGPGSTTRSGDPVGPGCSDRRRSSGSRNGMLFVWEGALGALILNLVSPFYTMFAKRMGADDFHIGLVSSLPALVGILALIPGALIVDRQRDKKHILGTLILFSGLLYPLLTLTPYLGKSRVILFIIVISLINWPFSVYGISWQSFFSDVFSRDSSVRNRVYANRSRIATLLGTICLVCSGIILSYVPVNDRQRVTIYQIFFIAAFVLSLLQRIVIRRIDCYELPVSLPRVSTFASVRSCFANLRKDAQFRNLIIIVFFFYISWQLSWPLFFIYQVDYLHANEAWIGYINIAAGIASTATFAFWNRVMERKGGRFITLIGCVGLTLNPALTVLSPNLYVLFAINLLLGTTFSAYQIGLFDNLMEVVPQKDKTLNIAIYTSLLGVSNLFSPMLGVLLYHLTDIHTAMYIDSGLRLAGICLLATRYFGRSGGRKVKEMAGGISV